LEGHRDWECVTWKNTAASAKKISEDGQKNQAAIANPLSAGIYGLKILQEKINAFNQNTTKFIVVGKKKCFRKDAGKVMVSFELPHESGSLYKALSHFIFNKLSMTKIESRPVPDKNWEYRFFVEFEGNLNDINVKTAIKGICEESLAWRLMGNY
jgi:chorismate mutase/prephenate dehydratase